MRSYSFICGCFFRFIRFRQKRQKRVTVVATRICYFYFQLIYSFYASSFPVASFFSGNTLHPSAARITAGTRSRPRSYKHKHHWYVKHAVFFPCFLEPACYSKEGRNSSQLVASTEQRPDFCVASYGQQGSRSRVIAIKYNILKT